MLARPTHPFARIDTLRHHALARPVVAAMLLVVGGVLLCSLAALVHRRDAAVTFMPASGVGPPGRGGNQALTLSHATKAPLAPEGASWALATDSIAAPAMAAEMVDDLEVMPTGVETHRPELFASNGRPAVDAAAPPLRIEILGLVDTAWTSVATTRP